MTDRELLKLAAKAAGYKIHSDAWACGPSGAEPTLFMGNDGPAWNPLTNDGDALRLVALLKMSVGYIGIPETHTVWVGNHRAQSYQPWEGIESMRRAIVRAAAFIGSETGDKP